MRTPRRSLLLAPGAALALAGCGGISDPYNDPQRAPGATGATATATQPPAATVEHPGMAPRNPDDPPPRPQRIAAAALSADAAATIARYAQLTGTWTWETVAGNYRRAAALALDGARVEAEQIVQQIPNDPRYRTQEVRQRTRLEGILLRGGSSSRPRYVVVQRRRIELRATPPSNAWIVTVVVLRGVGGRWAVSSWEDQG